MGKNALDFGSDSIVILLLLVQKDDFNTYIQLDNYIVNHNTYLEPALWRPKLSALTSTFHMQNISWELHSSLPRGYGTPGS